jgi:hypothetical protein
MDKVALEKRTIHLSDCGTLIHWPVDKASDAAPAVVVDTGRLEASWPGPVVFGCSVVLPEVAVIESLKMAVEASAALSMTINDQPLEQVSDSTLSAGLSAGQLPAPQPHALPGLAFTDFVEHRLNWRVDASPDEFARLNLDLAVQFNLPVESAAAYLTYIMTQA